VKRIADHLRDTIDQLPDAPGVYVFRDGTDQPLYVGKSKQLSQRVRQYFQPSVPDRKTAHLRALTKRIDVLVLDSEFQAREVEADLIRSYRPEYNSLYLDYMQRPLVKVSTNQPFPKVEVVPERDEESARYFGPYRSTRRLRRILDILGDIFPYRTCDYHIPEEGRPGELDRCHRYQLGRCKAPCVGDQTPEDYAKDLEKLMDFLDGSHDRVLNELDETIDEHARNHEYEAAGLIREYREAIDQLNEYNPFIRQTLDANFYHRTSDPEITGQLRVRDHRVSNFTIDTEHDSKPAKSDRRTVVSSTTGENQDKYKGRDPGNAEERQLLEALERTVSLYQSFPDNKQPIRDVVQADSETLTRLIGDRTLGDMSLKNRGDSLAERLVSHYALQIERGIPVPTTIESRNGDGPSARRVVQKALSRIRNQGLNQLERNRTET
jgi:excinuclease UvrABC nuclease subunit